MTRYLDLMLKVILILEKFLVLLVNELKDKNLFILRQAVEGYDKKAF